MAEKRMFSKKIIDSDAFLDMALSTQALYFHLSMRADDEGFINNPKKILRMIGASADELKILNAKKFVLDFDNGIIVIKHWKIHNTIRKDRIKETVHKDEMEQLATKENGSYTFNKLLEFSDDNDLVVVTDECQPNDNQATAQIRLDKISLEENRIGKGNEKTSRFTPPTLDEVKEYCLSRNNNVDAERWIDFYESKGWMIGKNKMKNWKAAVRTWEKGEKGGKPKSNNQKGSAGDYSEIESL